MSGDSDLFNLANHFLIAMPGLQDPLFSRSVVYMCEHTPRGALGLVINKPSDMSIGALFEQIALPLKTPTLVDAQVFHGGPLQMERGFVLHDSTLPNAEPTEQPRYASSMSIVGGLEMTTSKDVLEALANGSGPRRILLTLGYAAWGEGQLETELAQNSWLTVQADLGVIFETPSEKRYDQALALLGLEAWKISSQVGHA